MLKVKKCMNILNRLNYLKTSIIKALLRTGQNCPFCFNKHSETIKRKYIFTTLQRCHVCKLMFRAPTTTDKESNKFYQESYRQGFTTDCPSETLLKKYIKKNFVGTEKDYSRYTNIVSLLNSKKGAKLFDYGCSWGYGSFQFQKLGYDVSSYEISEPRKKYAFQKLGINIINELSVIPSESFDIFFSAHVLEHLTNLRETMNFAIKILKKNGFFIAFTPNGSIKCSNKKDHHKKWGIVHPNLLDEIFYCNFFQNYNYLITASPYDKTLVKDFFFTRRSYCNNLEDDELMIIVNKK